jgi:hypothetical protein
VDWAPPNVKPLAWNPSALSRDFAPARLETFDRVRRDRSITRMVDPPLWDPIALGRLLI